MQRLERYRGSLLGLATADSVGTTLEFKAPGTFAPISDMQGGGPFRLRPGEWTDDTSMALCLAESLVTVPGFDPQDQIQRYVRWYHDGHLSSTGVCFDIGNTVRTALERHLRTGEAYAGSADPMSAGNGSIMRLAPVPMFYREEPAKAIDLSGQSSRTTHAAEVAIDACRYFGALIVGALNGADKDDLLSVGYSPVAGYWQVYPLAPEIWEVAAGSFKERQPPEIKGTGYVVESLEAALWAFYNSRSFREGCLLAANLGNDADTTAAVFGQLAGAFYGDRAIPIEWLDKLALRGKIEMLAERLLYPEESAH